LRGEYLLVIIIFGELTFFRAQKEGEAWDQVEGFYRTYLESSEAALNGVGKGKGKGKQKVVDVDEGELRDVFRGENGAGLAWKVLEGEEGRKKGRGKIKERLKDLRFKVRSCPQTFKDSHPCVNTAKNRSTGSIALAIQLLK
jgi:hypothetical protein